ncbi:MAG: hypothetical protein AUJ51_00755 [Elusimicrobia bacterium CG1_02_56_21]|nr:MAG: hypothetical protein AUJ51_00755 [Elusimicrobia bacterium CG1_02_56_21]
MISGGFSRTKPERLKRRIATGAFHVALAAALFCVPAVSHAQSTAAFYVDAYGARPDGGADSTTAIRNAINAAMQAGQPAEVVFSSGTYRLDCPSATPAPCFTISKARDLTLRGQGTDTRLLIGNPIMGLVAVQYSTGITISGFSLDYSSLPFTQGTIVSVGGGESAIDLAVEPGFPELDQPIFAPGYLAQTFGMLFDPATPMLKGSASNAYTVVSISKNPDGSFHLLLSGIGGIAVGDRFALSNRSHRVTQFLYNKNITLKQVTVYAGPGPATIWVENTGQIIIDGLEVRRKPATSRLLSTGADAIHMLNTNGDLVIQNCYIEGMTDDAINTRSRAYYITGIVDAVTYELGAAIPLIMGHTVQVVDPVTKTARGTAKIILAQGKTVTVDQAIPNVAVGDVIFGAELASENALIKNNIFSNFRGIFRIRSSGAIFANNQILDPRNARILVAADIVPQWQEGPTLVNSLNGVYFNNNTVPGGAINIFAENYINLGEPVLSGDSAILTHPLVFNVRDYRALNPDLASYSDPDIMAHWLAQGIREGRQANLSFHASEYLKLHSDLNAVLGYTNFQGAIEQYLYGGAILELRKGSIYTNALVYNSTDYLLYNPDLAGMSDAQLGAHWLLHGLDAGRRANSTFYSRDYLARYPDLVASVGAANYRATIDQFVTGAFLLPASATTTAVGVTITMPPVYAELTSVKIYVPPGAFPAGTQITSQATTSIPLTGAHTNEAAAIVPFGPAVSFDLSAAGLQPEEPVRITLAYDPTKIPAGQDERNLHLFRFDTIANQWTLVSSQTDFRAHVLTAYTAHFSVFAPFFVTAGADISAIQVFPQPWEIGDSASQYYSNALTFSALPSGARVRLFTITNELVFDGTASQGGVLAWNGATRSGRKAASGTYYAVIESGGKRKVRRVVIIR